MSTAPHRLGNTRDSIKRIKELNNIPRNCILALFDLVGLYPHKRQEEGLKTMSEYLVTEENTTGKIENLGKMEIDP